MGRFWLSGLRKHVLCSCAALLAVAGVSRADETADLKAQLAAQQKQIEELRKLIEQGGVRPAAATEPAAPKVDDKEVQKIVEGYLKEHPGAGMPPSVQTGFESGRGFVIRSANDPKYVKWDDDCKIPFELRIRGRIQSLYEFYKVTDTQNHFTGLRSGNPTLPGSQAAGGIGPNSATAPDFSQLEVKRMRLIFEGTAFDPNLRYHIQLDGGTRGLTGVDPRQGSFNNAIGNVFGGQGDSNVDHAVRLFAAYVAYDWHPCSTEKGCGPDCPEGTYTYQPTITGIIGKFKPLFGLEEYLGSGNEQFVEFSMANWFFDAEDDNLITAAGTQVKAFDDRFYLQAIVTNGNETQLPNLVMDRLPGFNVGFWWDFGGTWNPDRKRWDLFGDCLSDIDWSCNPVVRLGGSVNLVPMDRRSLYTQAELDRVRVVPGQPNGGGNLDGVLNGAGINLVSSKGANINSLGASDFAADAFDSYSYNVFAAGKWHGFSLYNEWWLRNLDNFRGEKNYATGANRPILYNSTNFSTAGTVVSLFPAGVGILDFGTTVQGGYFVVPKKLELVARYSWVRGESGNINGDGNIGTIVKGKVTPGSQFSLLTPAQQTALGIPLVQPGATAGTTTPLTVRVVNHAFRHYQEADEVAVGVNYFFKRQLVKWQTDLSFYNGGNPAANGQSPAGFIPGVDGWMVRSQIQFAF